MSKQPTKSSPTSSSPAPASSASRREARRQRETQRKRQTYILIGVIVVGVIALIGAIAFLARPKPFDIELTDVSTEQPPNSDGLAWGGPETAAVVIQEYSDFQCPFCGRHAQQTLPLLIERYGDNPNVRYEYHPFAFIGDESVDAAAAGYCAAEQDLFWPFHDTVYAHQNGENLGQFSKANLKKIAEAVGLEMTAFNDCFDSGRERRSVNESLAKGRGQGVSTTPTFLINGQQVLGAQPASQFFTVIDQALANAGAQ